MSKRPTISPFLDEPVAWRRDDNLETHGARKRPVAEHIDKLLATARERFIPGTHLIRYGEGDWNDSLQPADPKHARLDGEQLDGGAALPADPPLRRGTAPRRPGERSANDLSELADRDAARFQPPPHPRRHGRRLRPVRRPAGTSRNSCFTRATRAPASATRCCR